MVEETSLTRKVINSGESPQAARKKEVETSTNEKKMEWQTSIKNPKRNICDSEIEAGTDFPGFIVNESLEDSSPGQSVTIFD